MAGSASISFSKEPPTKFPKAARAARITVHDNEGDNPPVEFVLNTSVRTWDQLKEKISEKLNIKPLRRVLTAEGRIIKSLDILEDGGHYIAVKLGGRPFRKKALPATFPDERLPESGKIRQ